jgi:hypothetical protein
MPIAIPLPLPAVRRFCQTQSGPLADSFKSSQVGRCRILSEHHRFLKPRSNCHQSEGSFDDTARRYDACR